MKNLSSGKHKIMWFFMASLCTALAARDILSVDIPQYLIVALAIAYIPFASYKDLIYYSAFFIPIVIGMNGIVLLFLFIALIYKSPSINRLQIAFLLYFVPIELIMFYILPTEHRINDVIIYSSFISIFFFVIFDKTRDIDYGYAIKLFCIAGVFALFLVAYHYVTTMGTGGLLEARMDDMYKYSDKNLEGETLFSLNANNTGYFSAVIYSCLLLGRKKLGIPIYLYYILIIADLVIGGLTVSRTWLFLVSATSIIYAIFYVSKAKLVLVIGLILLLGGGSSILFDKFYNSFESRLVGDDMKTANGRTELFEEYADYMSEHSEYNLFGVGTVSYKEIIRVHNSMHNGLQQIYVCTGLVGFLLFIYASYKFYITFVRHRKIPFLYFMPFFVAFVFLQTLQFLNPYILMLPVCIACMSIKWGNSFVKISR